VVRLRRAGSIGKSSLTISKSELTLLVFVMVEGALHLFPRKASGYHRTRVGYYPGCWLLSTVTCSVARTGATAKPVRSTFTLKETPGSVFPSLGGIWRVSV